MDKFDRELQRKMLSILIGVYPRSPQDMDYDSELIDSTDYLKLAANLIYLQQHQLIKLVEIKSRIEPEDWRWLFDSATATSKGVDFILNDGGLSAILNVTTIKFHRDAVVVLEDLIAISNISDADKEKAKSTLGELSAEALKTVVQTITTAGLTALMK